MVNKVMYDRVIPRYCVRMKDNKREALFYGKLPTKRVEINSLVSLHSSKDKFQVFNCLKGSLKIIKPEIMLLAENQPEVSRWNLFKSKYKPLQYPLQYMQLKFETNNFLFIEGNYSRRMKDKQLRNYTK